MKNNLEKCLNTYHHTMKREEKTRRMALVHTNDCEEASLYFHYNVIVDYLI